MRQLNFTCICAIRPSSSPGRRRASLLAHPRPHGKGNGATGCPGPAANPGPTPQAGSPPRPRHGPARRGRRHHPGHGRGGPAATGRAGPRGAPAASHLHQPHARVLLGPGEVQLALLAHGGAGGPAEAEDEAGGRCLLLPRPLYQSGPAEQRTPGGRWPAVAKPSPFAEHGWARAGRRALAATGLRVRVPAPVRLRAGRGVGMAATES